MPSATVRRRIKPETVDHQATSNRTHGGDDLTPRSVSGSVTAAVSRARVPVGPPSGVARYEFEQDATDAWGTYDGSINGGSFTTNAAVGSYAYSTGGEGYIDVGILPLSGSISVSAWLYPTQVTTEGYAVNNYGGTGDAQHYILGTGAGVANDRPVFFVDNGSVDRAAPGQAVTTGEYYHLVGVYDDGASEVRLYVNGSLAATNNYSGTTPNFQERGTRIGESAIGGRDFEGGIDRVSFFNKPLSDAEASNLYNTGSIRV